jgi:RHS repeat-associated protein
MGSNPVGKSTVIAESRFNDLGELVEKNLNKTRMGALQSVDYAYNIRGWLTHQNNVSNNCSGGIDIAPPAPIRDFSFSMVLNGPDDLGFIWTSAADDNRTLSSGLTNGYYLYFDSAPFTQEDVDNGSVGANGTLQLPLFIPVAPGEIVGALRGFSRYWDSGTDWYFALVSEEDAGNRSLLSNMLRWERSTGTKSHWAPAPSYTPVVNPQEEINKDLFSMQLVYNEGVKLPGGFTPRQFNGNVSGMIWQVGDNDCKVQGYAYRYDGMNRLVNADYAVRGVDPTFGSLRWRQDESNYDVNGIRYDLNGNILELNRRGMYNDPSPGQPVSAANFGMMDALTYIYKGNQLTILEDNIPVTSSADQFIDKTYQGFYTHSDTTSWEYQYDANGNIIVDKNKGIQISYNHFNKPVLVEFLDANGNPSGNSIRYTYDATGTKLRQTVNQQGNTEVVDYSNGFHYKDGALEFFSHAEGRVFLTSYDPNNLDFGLRYEYNLKDHLGNVRVSFADLDSNGIIDPTTEILQSTHYYPFGARMGGIGEVSGLANKYLYNGKELHDELGLGWYDYGFRWYDPTIARFASVDPLAEEFTYLTPYQYAANSPIANIDLDGLENIYYLDFAPFARWVADQIEAAGGPNASTLVELIDGIKNMGVDAGVSPYDQARFSKIRTYSASDDFADAFDSSSDYIGNLDGSVAVSIGVLAEGEEGYKEPKKVPLGKASLSTTFDSQEGFQMSVGSETIEEWALKLEGQLNFDGQMKIEVDRTLLKNIVNGSLQAEGIANFENSQQNRESQNEESLSNSKFSISLNSDLNYVAYIQEVYLFVRYDSDDGTKKVREKVLIGRKVSIQDP